MSETSALRRKAENAQFLTFLCAVVEAVEVYKRQPPAGV